MLLNAILHPESLRHLTLGRWDKLLCLARRSNLIGRIAETAYRDSISNELPWQVRRHLEAARVLSMHQRQAIQWEIRHLGEALDSLDVPKILLKGTAYAAKDLDAACGRLFSDVDLLVPSSHLARAEAALMLKGWGCDAGDPYDQRYYREWMHEIPPMVHRIRGTVVDLHHNILPLTARNCPIIQQFFDDAISSPIPGFKLLSPVDMVIHSATHLFYESEVRNGLRDLFDLKALLGQFSANDHMFLSRLSERASKTGLSWPLLLTIIILKNILAVDIPNDVLRDVRKTAKIGRVTEILLSKVYLAALLPASSPIERVLLGFCRFVIYIRGHYLRMPLGLLIPHLSRKAIGRLIKSSNRIGK